MVFTLHEYTPGDMLSPFTDRQMDHVWLGNGYRYYFKSERLRITFFAAVNKNLNECYFDFVRHSSEVITLYLRYYHTLDPYALNDMPQKWLWMEKHRRQLVNPYMYEKNTNSFRIFRNLLSLHREFLKIIRKAGVSRKNYVLVHLVDSLTEENERIRARVGYIEYPCTVLSERPR